MKKIGILDKKVNVQFTVEEFLGLVNRRDNAVYIAKILASAYKSDECIQEFVKCLDNLIEGYAIVCERINTELDVTLIDES